MPEWLSRACANTPRAYMLGIRGERWPLVLFQKNLLSRNRQAKLLAGFDRVQTSNQEGSQWYRATGVELTL